MPIALPDGSGSTGPVEPGSGPYPVAVQMPDVAGVKALARAMRQAASDLGGVSDDAQHDVQFHTSSWSGQSQQNFLSMWGNQITGVMAPPPMPAGLDFRAQRLWEADHQQQGVFSAAFPTIINDLWTVADQLDSFASAVVQAQADDDKIAFDFAVTIVALAITFFFPNPLDLIPLSFSGLGGVAARIGLGALDGALSFGGQAAVQELGNDVIQGTEVDHQGFFQALTDPHNLQSALQKGLQAAGPGLLFGAAGRAAGLTLGSVPGVGAALATPVGRAVFGGAVGAIGTAVQEGRVNVGEDLSNFAIGALLGSKGEGAELRVAPEGQLNEPSLLFVKDPSGEVIGAGFTMDGRQFVSVDPIAGTVTGLGTLDAGPGGRRLSTETLAPATELRALPDGGDPLATSFTLADAEGNPVGTLTLQPGLAGGARLDLKLPGAGKGTLYGYELPGEGGSRQALLFDEGNRLVGVAGVQGLGDAPGAASLRVALGTGETSTLRLPDGTVIGSASLDGAAGDRRLDVTVTAADGGTAFQGTLADFRRQFGDASALRDLPGARVEVADAASGGRLAFTVAEDGQLVSEVRGGALHFADGVTALPDSLRAEPEQDGVRVLLSNDWKVQTYPAEDGRVTLVGPDGQAYRFVRGEDGRLSPTLDATWRDAPDHGAATTGSAVDEGVDGGSGLEVGQYGSGMPDLTSGEVAGVASEGIAGTESQPAAVADGSARDVTVVRPGDQSAGLDVSDGVTNTHEPAQGDSGGQGLLRLRIVPAAQAGTPSTVRDLTDRTTLPDEVPSAPPPRGYSAGDQPTEAAGGGTVEQVGTVATAATRATSGAEVGASTALDSKVQSALWNRSRIPVRPDGHFEESPHMTDEEGPRWGSIRGEGPRWQGLHGDGVSFGHSDGPPERPEGGTSALEPGFVSPDAVAAATHQFYEEMWRVQAMSGPQRVEGLRELRRRLGALTQMERSIGLRFWSSDANRLMDELKVYESAEPKPAAGSAPQLATSATGAENAVVDAWGWKLSEAERELANKRPTAWQRLKDGAFKIDFEDRTRGVAKPRGQEHWNPFTTVPAGHGWYREVLAYRIIAGVIGWRDVIPPTVPLSLLRWDLIPLPPELAGEGSLQAWVDAKPGLRQVTDYPAPFLHRVAATDYGFANADRNALNHLAQPDRAIDHREILTPPDGRQVIKSDFVVALFGEQLLPEVVEDLRKPGVIDGMDQAMALFEPAGLDPKERESSVARFREMAEWGSIGGRAFDGGQIQDTDGTIHWSSSRTSGGWPFGSSSKGTTGRTAEDGRHAPDDEQGPSAKAAIGHDPLPFKEADGTPSIFQAESGFISPTGEATAPSAEDAWMGTLGRRLPRQAPDFPPFVEFHTGGGPGGQAHSTRPVDGQVVTPELVQDARHRLMKAILRTMEVGANFNSDPREVYDARRHLDAVAKDVDRLVRAYDRAAGDGLPLLHVAPTILDDLRVAAELLRTDLQATRQEGHPAFSDLRQADRRLARAILRVQETETNPTWSGWHRRIAIRELQFAVENARRLYKQYDSEIKAGDEGQTERPWQSLLLDLLPRALDHLDEGSQQLLRSLSINWEQPPGSTLEETRFIGELDGMSPPDEGVLQILLEKVPRGPDGEPERFPDPHGEWVRYVNGAGPVADAARATNCGDCVLSLYETFHGRPTAAVPTFRLYGANSAPNDEAESTIWAKTELWFGGRLEFLGGGASAVAAVESRVRSGGHGSFAYVVIERDPSAPLHAIAAINHGGRLLWVDPQIGRVWGTIDANWTRVWAIALGPDGSPMSDPREWTAEQPTGALPVVVAGLITQQAVASAAPAEAPPAPEHSDAPAAQPGGDSPSEPLPDNVTPFRPGADLTAAANAAGTPPPSSPPPSAGSTPPGPPNESLAELRSLPRFGTMTGPQIEQDLLAQGYTRQVLPDRPPYAGTTILWKDFPDGHSVAVRVDPPATHHPPGSVSPEGTPWVDMVDHAHKETVPTSEISNGNYFRPAAVQGLTRYDDNGNQTTDVNAFHIPIRRVP